MAENTEHLDLVRPDLADYFHLADHLNGNWDKLDAYIGAAKGSKASVDARLDVALNEDGTLKVAVPAHMKFCIQGTAKVVTKIIQALTGTASTISKVKIYSDTAPTGAALIVDVNKNGTTIFTTQGNRPTIAIDGHADDSGTPDVTSVAEGDRLSVDIDQVGSTVAGGDDLLVTIVLS